MVNGLRRACALGFVSLAGLLAACSSNPFEEVTPPACPKAFLPKDTSHIVQFSGNGRDLTDVLFEGEFDGYMGDCGYDLDDRKLEVVISPVVTGELGPAASGRQASFQYFVALKNPAGEFVQKSVFDVPLVFPGTLNVARFRDEKVTLDIDLDDVNQGPEYEIYMGFQLSAEQLDYNRRFGKN